MMVAKMVKKMMVTMMEKTTAMDGDDDEKDDNDDDRKDDREVVDKWQAWIYSYYRLHFIIYYNKCIFSHHTYTT